MRQLIAFILIFLAEPAIMLKKHLAFKKELITSYSLVFLWLGINRFDYCCINSS